MSPVHLTRFSKILKSVFHFWLRTLLKLIYFCVSPSHFHSVRQENAVIIFQYPVSRFQQFWSLNPIYIINFSLPILWFFIFCNVQFLYLVWVIQLVERVMNFPGTCLLFWVLASYFYNIFGPLLDVKKIHNSFV